MLPGATSYPISSFTWLLIPMHFADASKGAAVKRFLTWMLDQARSEAASMGYAPLPKQVVDMERKTIAEGAVRVGSGRPEIDGGRLAFLVYSGRASP